jgi:hypothetical protein
MSDAVRSHQAARGASVTDLRNDTEAPVAGWYPDPVDSGAQRWWSGNAWTDHVSREPRGQVAAPAATPTSSATTAAAGAVPVALFADSVFTHDVFTPPPGPTSQSDWHQKAGRGTTARRGPTGGSVSLSTAVPTAASRKHDPYRQRNWIAGLAVVLAVLSIPALAWRITADLPPLTESIFAGAPVGIALLALLASVRRGVGVVASIIAVVLSVAVLAVGFLVDPAIITSAVDAVLGLFPS